LGLRIGFDMLGRVGMDVGMTPRRRSPGEVAVVGSRAFDMCGCSSLVGEGMYSGVVCMGLVLVGRWYTLDGWGSWGIGWA
jgi:hypothetical protein